ncbi:MAG: trypsin-like peptidase domain-containing protein [Gemmatimonadetes bacterium]|nr:trypsin-like peptidase domain-containing protein [Gemmatimonadota bacterium]
MRGIPNSSEGHEAARAGLLLRPAAALAGVAVLIACGGSPEARAAVGQQSRSAERSVSTSRRSAIVEAARRVAPAVVSVTVVRRERQVPTDPFDFFFVPRGYEREVQGFGTGFLVSPDGVVITNQHVTEGASQIAVTTPDGSEYPARLLGEDALTDIAILRIEARGLATAPIGRSDDLMIGEWVVAFGNPYGYLLGNAEPTVTAGVVSAVGRNLYPSGGQPGVYLGMIQTDAAINPGNSGGPLANAVGEVVGVNSSIFSNTGSSVGIGFAIPIERAMRVADELRRYGRVRRAWVGLDVAGQDSQDWRKIGGLRVTAVAPGSPAARADIRPGDVLVSARGRRLRNFLDWEAVKLDIGVGDSLAAMLRRGGAERSAVLRVEDLPTSRAQKVAVLGDLQVITVTPAIRAERGIRSSRGAMIYEIGPETQEATGLTPGDVIFQVNRQPVSNADDLQRIFRSVQGRSPIRVYFERSGQMGYSDFYVQ